MQKVTMIKNDAGLFVPFSLEDKQACLNYPAGGLTSHNIKGVTKPRSYQQLKLYFACCRALADQTENINLNNETKVHFVMRMRARWIESIISIKKPCPSCQVLIDYNQIIPKSLSYENCTHADATQYINSGINEIASEMGVPKYKLVKNADRYGF